MVALMASAFATVCFVGRPRPNRGQIARLCFVLRRSVRGQVDFCPTPPRFDPARNLLSSEEVSKVHKQVAFVHDRAALEGDVQSRAGDLECISRPEMAVTAHPQSGCVASLSSRTVATRYRFGWEA